MGLLDRLFGNKNTGQSSAAPVNKNIERAISLPEEYRNMEEQPAPPQATPRKRVIYDPPEQHARIIVDSLNLIFKTKNPDTFFYRYKLASNEACGISDVDGAIYNGMNARQIYDWLNDRESKNKLQRDFIDKLFEEGRENSIAYQTYEVGYSMTPESRQYYIDRLNGKRFHFCKVKFDVGSNKLYTYITKDESVKVGDTVSVPTGNSYVPESKVVQVEETFDGALEDLPFEITSLRCVERKLKGIQCPHCGASISIDVGKKTGKCEHCGAEFFMLQ